MYRHFLVFVDDSDAAIDTVAHAVALARSVGARITFAPLARAPQSAAGRLLDDRMREVAILKAEAAARAQGVPCEPVHVTGAPAQRGFASALGCDLVCVAARAVGAGDGVGKPVDFDAGPLAAQFASPEVPVLGCTVRRSPASARVVAALYRAHRATAGALCEQLLAHREWAAAGSADPEAACGQTVLPGFDALRTPHLGPGDVCVLSSLLRRRTSVVDAELGELERQHRRGTALFAELARAVAAALAGVAPPVRIDETLHCYAQFVWEYFGRKEGVIVPAAQRYLREDDWREIEAVLGTGVMSATRATSATSGTGAAMRPLTPSETTRGPHGQRA